MASLKFIVVKKMTSHEIYLLGILLLVVLNVVRHFCCKFLKLFPKTLVCPHKNSKEIVVELPTQTTHLKCLSVEPDMRITMRYKLFVSYCKTVISMVGMAYIPGEL